MARSKKVRKALEIDKQLKQSRKITRDLEESRTKLIVTLSPNEVIEYQGLHNREALKEFNNET